MKIAKDLLISLLNATILLLIILAFLILLLVGRVEAVRESVVDAVAMKLFPQAERLEQIGDQLMQINTQLETADGAQIDALRQEIAALREKMPNFSRLEDLAAVEIAQQIINGIGQELSSKSGN
jgi:hypothetical protein